MRVIKEGKIPLREIVHVCETCDTVFAFFKNDIQMIKLWCDSKKIYYIHCPICGQEIITDEESYRKLS